MSGIVFEVMICELPTKEEAKEGRLKRIVSEIKTVVAKDAQAAAIRYVMDNQESMKGVDRDRMEVLVRPFVS